ncbi:MAG: cyclic nucleotide-binding domain-containing protein [Proteobacteria bacterium]|nr:cyclic nucleotide-binding domain-containing protein [Pseudomonadota bacterium]
MKPAETKEERGVIILPEVDYSYVLDEEQYKPGEDLVREGHHGDWTGVILDGRADVFKATDNGPVLIGRMGPGAIIGDLSILTQRRNVRTATVRARTPLTLGILDLQQVYWEFVRLPQDLRLFLESMNRRLGAANHSLMALYAGTLNPGEKFRGQDRPLPLDKEFGTARWIRSGNATLGRPVGSALLPLATLSSGDHLGALPFVDLGQEPHGALVFVSPDFSAEPLDVQDLESSFILASSMVQHFTACVAAMIRETCRRATVLFQETLPPPEKPAPLPKKTPLSSSKPPLS